MTDIISFSCSMRGNFPMDKNRISSKKRSWFHDRKKSWKLGQSTHFSNLRISGFLYKLQNKKAIKK